MAHCVDKPADACVRLSTSPRSAPQGNLVTTVAALAVTVITSSNSGFAGLVISSAMSITGVMNWLVRQGTTKLASDKRAGQVVVAVG